MIKSEMKRNSNKQAILWSVCLLLANAHIYNTLISALYLYLHPQTGAKTPASTLFSSTRTHKQRRHYRRCETSVCSLSSVSTELLMSIQGYGKVLDLLWSFPAFLIITKSSHSPPEHDPYPVCGIFLERLCHS